MKEMIEDMEMTDRQFDSYQARMLKILKTALAESPENATLKELISEIEAELKRP